MLNNEFWFKLPLLVNCTSNVDCEPNPSYPVCKEIVEGGSKICQEPESCDNNCPSDKFCSSKNKCKKKKKERVFCVSNADCIEPNQVCKKSASTGKKTCKKNKKCQSKCDKGEFCGATDNCQNGIHSLISLQFYSPHI